MLRSSWVAAQLAASQEGLSTTSEWVTQYRDYLGACDRMITECWMWNSLRDKNWHGKRKKTRSSPTPSTANPTRPDFWLKSGCRVRNRRLGRLNYGTAHLYIIYVIRPYTVLWYCIYTADHLFTWHERRVSSNSNSCWSTKMCRIIPVLVLKSAGLLSVLTLQVC
jgi:hypothetical protein